MKVTNKSLAAFIFPLLALLLFQNCAPTQVAFKNETKSLALNQNGDGYLGKPPAGDWLRTYPGYNCTTPNLATDQIQGVMTVNESGSEAQLSRDNCRDFSFKIPWGDPNWEYYPYNPDYFTFNSAVFESRESFEQTLRAPVEMFCRFHDGTEGLDVVAKIESSEKSAIRIYSGRKSAETWSRFQVPSFGARKIQSSVQVQYVADSFDLKIDTSMNDKSISTGRLTAQIGGVEVKQNMVCRSMRIEPVLANTKEGLIGLWQLNGSFVDLSGHNNHIVPLDPNNRLSFPPGVYNQSVQLDGVTTRLQVNPSSTVNNLGPMTVVAWVFPVSDNIGQTHGGIAHKSDEPVGPTKGWQFYIPGQTVHLEFKAVFSGGTLHTGTYNTDDLTVNTWNHVAMTWDGSSLATGVKFYINGVLKPATGFRRDGTGSRVADTDLPLFLGDWLDYKYPSLHTGLKGNMDHVALWNRILTPAEIQNMYRFGTP